MSEARTKRGRSEERSEDEANGGAKQGPFIEKSEIKLVTLGVTDRIKIEKLYITC